MTDIINAPITINEIVISAPVQSSSQAISAPISVGQVGPAGKNFTYSKTYSSVAEMLADNPPEGVPEGGFVIISSTVEDPDNAKVYTYFNGNFAYIADLSGSQGAIGNPGGASELYVQSRGQGLITNGSGLLGTNYNFSGFTYDQTEVSGGFGSFKTGSLFGTKFSDEFIPVNPGSKYLLVGTAKSGDSGGGNYDPDSRQYFGVSLYDIDGNNVGVENSCKYSGSTDTTLSTQLNPGDTQVFLTNATGWYNGSSGTNRHFSWWPYINTKGYSWENYTYSRNLTGYITGIVPANGAWTAGGITGNVITLLSPWQGPALPVGTAVRNSPYGSTYKYIGASNVIIPNTWTKYSGTISPADGTGIENTNQFRVGTVKLRLVFLTNRGSLPNNVRWCNLDFGSLQSIT